jgi:hypothetical protein
LVGRGTRVTIPVVYAGWTVALIGFGTRVTIPVVYTAWTVAVVGRGAAESPLAAAMVLAQSVAFTEQINAGEKILERRHLKSSVNADLGLPSGRGKSGPQRRSDLTFPEKIENHYHDFISDWAQKLFFFCLFTIQVH